VPALLDDRKGDLRKGKEPMLVRDFMTKEVTCLQETDSLLDATMIFVRSTLRHLPILRDKHLVGVVTERDIKQFTPSILSGITADEYNRLMESTPLSRTMTRDPVTVEPDQSISEAAKILFTRRIGCLPVVENGELKGILTTTDLMKLLLRLLEAQEAGSG
jgi:CBS domain-containing protein